MGEAGAGVDLARPADDDRAGWRAYWAERGMPWRSEPEIGAERRAYLGKRRAVAPDIERGIYPFRDENGSIKLDRADVEWLLGTHESRGMRGPVDWEDASQWKRPGLDLRGADLREADLRLLPLSQLRGGLTHFEWLAVTDDARRRAALRLDGAILADARLERAVLRDAHLKGADLRGAELDEAAVSGACLEGAVLRWTNLEGAHLSFARLGGADMRLAYFDTATNLRQVDLGSAEVGAPCMAGTHWGGVDVSGIDWGRVRMLGDERVARRGRDALDARKDAHTRCSEFEAAVRASRQVAMVLRAQGLNEDADRFAFRAQVLQREVLRRQGSWGRWLFSWLLAVLAGYGYRLWRIFAAYALVVTLFAAGYFFSGHVLSGPGVSWRTVGQGMLDAYQVSLNAVHGRVFFVQFGLDTLQSWLATAESIIGIVIEGVFVAMIIQRFFSR